MRQGDVCYSRSIHHEDTGVITKLIKPFTGQEDVALLWCRRPFRIFKLF